MTTAPARSSRVVIVGSLNADLTIRTEALPRPGQTLHGTELRVLPGGKGANQAVAAALLGAGVAMVGAVGGDEHGALLRCALRRAGVDDAFVVTVPEVPTGVALITVDGAGENTIVLSAGANGAFTPGELENAGSPIPDADVLGLSLEIPRRTALAAAHAARACGVPVILNLSPYQADAGELLRAVDALIVNEHEAAELQLELGSPGFGDVLRHHGITEAIVTRGSAGCTVYTSGGRTDLDAVPVRAVDATGCGDAFFGAVLCSLASGESLVAAARFAAAVAAIAAESFGAQASYPDSDTVSRRLEASVVSAP